MIFVLNLYLFILSICVIRLKKYNKWMNVKHLRIFYQMLRHSQLIISISFETCALVCCNFIFTLLRTSCSNCETRAFAKALQFYFGFSFIISVCTFILSDVLIFQPKQNVPKGKNRTVCHYNNFFLLSLLLLEPFWNYIPICVFAFRQIAW